MKLKELFTAKNMTEGEPWKRIGEFAIPMLLGNLAQTLYNTADSVIVGKFVGDNALAAVGSASPVLNLLLALFIGISAGAGIVISQNYGAGDREGLSRAIGNCLFLSAVITVVIMVVGTVLAYPLLTLLRTPPAIIQWCRDYLNIFFLGSVGFVFYNMLSGILRGMGDSVSALFFLLLATVLNIILDIWFVAGFDMGVPGVALATVMAQFISAMACMWKLLKMRDVFDLNRDSLRPRRNVSMRIIRIGLPSGLTQAIMSISMLVTQSLTNSMGEMVVAANVIIMRVDSFAMMPNFTFGQTMSVYTGQNVGAGRLDRVEKGTRQGLIMAGSISVVLTVILLMFGPVLFRFFTTTESLIALSMRMMRMLALGYIAVSFTQVLSGVMRGTGDTATPMWISLANSVLIRVPLAYLVAYLTRCEEYPNGIPWYSLTMTLLISWCIGGAITGFLFARGGWRRKAEASIRELGDK